MANAFWPLVLPPLLAGVGLSFMLEQFVAPGTRMPWKRHPSELCIHTGLWLLLFSVEFVLFRRPWLAAANVSAVLLALILASNAKFQSLREPFIYQDFDYCADLIRHPRLYLPFLGIGRAILAVGAIGLVLFAGVKLEPLILQSITPADFLKGEALIFLSGFVLVGIGATRRVVLTLDPVSDLRELGLLSSLWRYAVAERAPCRAISSFDSSYQRHAAIEALPDVVVVQSESFFDARRQFPVVNNSILERYDQIKSAAIYHGQMAVPAWGANTVRTEFAFLSGLAAASLGVHRFNPYRKLIRKDFPTLASYLKRLGYRTICVHPYPASFYGRDQVYPLLGFDRFMDISCFRSLQSAGPYVDDVTLAEKVCEVLGEDRAYPVFLFVITMENHGPLHLEEDIAGDAAPYVSAPLPESCRELPIYLRHLKHADRMAGMLRECLDQLPRPAMLCSYGDHVPIMPGVYKRMGEPDGKTDYFMWRKGGASGNPVVRDLSIEELGPLLLKEMGMGPIK